MYNVPIEPLEMRYSAQWLQWFDMELSRLGIAPNFIMPRACDGLSYAAIQRGQFLDVIGTNKWKAGQLSGLCTLMESTIKDGDIIFFHDLWFPGIEMLFYMRDALKRDFKIAGILHAGTYDKHDYLTQCGMARWATHIEHGWINEYDLIFVGSQYHADLLRRERMASFDTIFVSGLPLMSSEYDGFNAKRDTRGDVVVFPHRIAREKQPELFAKLKEALPQFTYVRTQDVARTRKEYHSILAGARVAVSFALQETWGIAMQEAAYLGCVPIVPAKLAYKDMYLASSQYTTWGECVDHVKWAIECYDDVVSNQLYRLWLSSLKHLNNTAIRRMVSEMRARGWSL